MAIIQGTVRVVEQARLREQVDKFGAAKAIPLPINPRRRAGPVLVFEEGPCHLGEFPVKCCIVSNDDVRVSDEAFKSCSVDLVPGNHRIRNAGELHNFRRDSYRRLIEGLENASDAGDLTAVRITKFDHRHFDDFVRIGIKSGRLEIDDDPDLAGAPGRQWCRLLWDKAAQNPVVARGFEPTGDTFSFFDLI